MAGSPGPDTAALCSTTPPPGWNKTHTLYPKDLKRHFHCVMKWTRYPGTER